MNHYLHLLKTKTEKLLDKLKELKLQPQDLFLPKLVFIDQEGILPGALLPEGTQTLVFKDRNITPILPLNPILLEYFTSEELTKQLKFELIDEDNLSQVRLILNLPIIESPLFKDYTLKEENIIYEVPVLEIWPNFQAEVWNEYYGFYYDAEYGEETFQVNFPNVEEIKQFQEGKGNYQIVRCNNFPNFIECKNSQYNIIGIIVLLTPQKIDLLSLWKIGIDFKSDYTSVYVNKNDKVIKSFNLENLHYKVTYVLVETRFPVLFEHFIPESFIPIDKPFPMSTMLTTRGSADINQERPIFDGRIYIPARNRYEPQATWVKKDLKWSNENLKYIRLFLKHLTLHLTANAVKNQVKEIQWCISYPPDFSRKDKYEYVQMWQDIIKDLQIKTGIKHLCPNINDSQYFRSENLALGQYFAEYEGYDLVSTTCIHIGNIVTNISIWENDQLIHQCSINFGKRDLFSQFIQMNPDILRILDIDSIYWIRLSEDAFYEKLDVWLRLEAATWLERKRDLSEEDKDFQGLITLMSIGLSGLYFYIGNILSVLHQEGKYTLDEITPVYIGGIGSPLLHWLAEGGKFDRNSEINGLFSRMMSIASGFPDTEELTRISQNPQDEIACGLVLQDRRLQELDRKEIDYVITGENCKINDEEFGYQNRLDLRGRSIITYQIHNLTQLNLFLNVFHISLDDLVIDGIKSLEGYEFEKEDQDAEYNQKLWKATAKELINYDVEDIQQEPPFILELKALLRVLCKEITNK
jgi:hypothetical protein